MCVYCRNLYHDGYVLLPSCSFGRGCACVGVGVCVGVCVSIGVRLTVRNGIRVRICHVDTVCLCLCLCVCVCVCVCLAHAFSISFLHLQLLGMANTDVNGVREYVEDSCCFC